MAVIFSVNQTASHLLKNITLGPTNIVSSLLATLVRTGSGISVNLAVLKPEIPFKLFDIEGCPYCRLVREVLTELDLDTEIYPCPKQGERYRAYVNKIGGKAQFPFLIDPNTDVQMYESLSIIKYLFETYGKRSLPLKWQLGSLQTISSMLASTVRLGLGMTKKNLVPQNNCLNYIVLSLVLMHVWYVSACVNWRSLIFCTVAVELS